MVSREDALPKSLHNLFVRDDPPGVRVCDSLLYGLHDVKVIENIVQAAVVRKSVK